MDGFDGIGKRKDEINDLRNEMRHLMYLQSSSENDDDSINEQIEDLRKQLSKLRFELSVLENEMGDEYDRYQNNQRK
ncbi:MAG: hypothetical protein IKF82_06180 [Bacilli bacterium]|nr:hypothetical protein [Bacilli bacterium]MBR3209836.1 hypothetical protein [Bacilli bacterium]